MIVVFIMVDGIFKRLVDMYTMAKSSDNLVEPLDSAIEFTRKKKCVMHSHSYDRR